MIVNGERQVAPTLDGIRRDHRARYDFAARLIPAGSSIIDASCGIGYGSRILADPGNIVLGVDKSAEAVRYGEQFFPHDDVSLQVGDVCAAEFPEGADWAVSFETVEHLEDPEPFLKALRLSAQRLIASVPNEDVMPFGEGFDFHYRHYTRDEFESLLADCGWRVVEWHGQEDDQSDVEQNVEGRTLIAVCERGEIRNEVAADETSETAPQAPPVVRPTVKVNDFGLGVPRHVAILGLGPSLEQYVDIVKRLGGKHAFCDEVWGINAVAGVILCDRVFHMDDVRVQERRAAALPQSNIARMLEWLRVHPGPVITSRSHPDYPGLVDFPLAEVMSATGQGAYFNSTAAYAIAYAVALGVERISMFGMDFTYANSHQAERGRACVEYWLGIAAARGIQIAASKKSTLLDAIEDQEGRLYGYDTLDVTIRTGKTGLCEIDFVPKPDESVPTADEIEARYDHNAHPNALVERGAS